MEMKPIYLKILILASILSLACTTKVSEWVLLNSLPNRYMLVYYQNGTIPEVAVQNNKELENRLKTANVTFKQVLKRDIELPYYALYYNNQLFSEYRDYNELSGIESSPLREFAANELMVGKLCVMLYLKTGNSEKDEPGLLALKNSIASSPFGNVISIVELDKRNAEEKQLVSMLLNVERDLKTISEPMLFGIFGRFRTLEPLIARGISEENIGLMIDFFTADCSCVIKDDLPGISILYKSNWENPKPAQVNAIIDANPLLEHH